MVLVQYYSDKNIHYAPVYMAFFSIKTPVLFFTPNGSLSHPK